jgi:hypothetical protein
LRLPRTGGFRLRLVLLLLATLGGGRSLVTADQGWSGHTVSLTWENDAVAFSDRHYTQGARVGYLAPDNAMPRWTERMLRHMPSWGYQLKAQRLGLELGQEIYTPEDLGSTTVVQNDRPYAGWLYASAVLQRRGKGTTWPVMETWRVDLGVIGPESLAEDTQKEWHGQDPRGWEHQIKTEPGLNLRYDRRYLFAMRAKASAWEADFMPYCAASLGNVATHLGLGTLVRFGYGIPNEFAVPDAAAEPGFGVYFFAGAEGRWVVRNIFLDGNTFRDSHEVDKEPLVADIKGGLAVVLKWVELSASYVYRTKEFETQMTHDSFGSATITVRF